MMLPSALISSSLFFLFEFLLILCAIDVICGFPLWERSVSIERPALGNTHKNPFSSIPTHVSLLCVFVFRVYTKSCIVYRSLVVLFVSVIDPRLPAPSPVANVLLWVARHHPWRLSLLTTPTTTTATATHGQPLCLPFSRFLSLSPDKLLPISSSSCSILAARDCPGILDGFPPSGTASDSAEGPSQLKRTRMRSNS